jgi:hypothetical protein
MGAKQTKTHPGAFVGDWRGPLTGSPLGDDVLRLMSYWAVARTAPNHDRWAAECVAQAGFETFTPKIRTRSGAQWRTVPLFPRYFFVHVIDRWRVV